MNEVPSGPIDSSGRGNALIDQYLPGEYALVPRPREPIIDRQALFGLLYRQRWLIGATIAATLAMGLIVTLLAVPVYEARTTLEVDPYGNPIVTGQDVSGSVPTTQIAAFMQTQGEIIESRKIALQVAQKIDALGRLDQVAGVDPNDPAEDRERLDRAADALQGGVSVEAGFGSQVVSIFYRHTDPVFTAEVANAYADAYAESETARNLESNSYARSYLQDQIGSVREKLREAEIAANEYARQYGIVTQKIIGDGDGDSITITGANLASINQTLASARAARIAAEQKWRAVANMPASEIPEVQGSSVVATLQARRADIASDLSDLRQRYDDNFPAVADAQARLATLDAQIQSVGQEIKAGIRNEFVIAQRQEQALSGELNNVSRRTLSEQDRQIQYAVLERETTALRAQLDSLLQRFNDISTAANVRSGRITKLDAAVVPRSPISPNLSRNMLLALIAGLGLAGALAVLREVFDDKMRSLEQVEDRLGLPLLGHTPHVSIEDTKKPRFNAFGNLMEAYSSIRTSIDFSIPRSGYVLQTTSSHGGEGKSTTALILAELFAKMGRKTLLIDADLRSPSLATLVDGDPQAQGLSNVILGNCSVEEAKVAGISENLEILFSGPLPANPVEMLSSKEFAALLQTLRSEYSLVIIDCPPVLGLADAPQIAQVVDGTIFIAEANSAPIGEAKSAIRRLNAVGCRFLGAVLTKYRPLEAGQTYGYGYQYASNSA